MPGQITYGIIERKKFTYRMFLSISFVVDVHRVVVVLTPWIVVVKKQLLK